ncbi:hypothetical protein [uncultured Gammaproteobacteria bacterium]|nr:hypothetical protein [uncultured Gammaproteobacteria bacterium]
MRLISLTANQSTFKSINFNKEGASFIVAKQNNPEQFDNTRTYNGVGKSLLIALINFCLGASIKNKITKSLQEKLPDWQFFLTVEIEDKLYIMERHANFPKKIKLNNESLSVSDFCEKLQTLCFDVLPDIKYLSFRSLLPFFIRPSKKAYVEYDEPEKAGTPYQKQLYNAFLLGLNVNLSQTKMSLKKEITNTKKLHRNIKNDPILRQFFEGYQDSSLALADLDEKINKLDGDLKKFEVADDYYQIKQESDEIKRKIDKTQNTIKLKNNSLHNIKQSLKINPDVDKQEIKNIYNESKLVFQAMAEKQLSELESFYQALTVGRSRRLKQQERLILNEVQSLEKEFSALKQSFDNKMKFLDAHKALDIFTKMSANLSELVQNKDKLQGYEKLQHDYEQKKISLQKDMLLQSEKTANYLDDAKKDIHVIMEYFRVLAKLFYPSSLSGITVKNNDGANQTRYDIEAKIQSDSSDGINSVKLFCYDVTILMQENNHTMDFIFHDSRLFSDIDETHCNELFKIVQDRFSDKQYIASINQNQLNTLSEEMKKFVIDNTILELTDNLDSGKLLGITVELEYD